MKKFVFIPLLLAVCSLFAGEKIRMHAHRGEPSLAPQNTVESIKLAFDLGALMIETDCWLTKDGSMVICHERGELKKYWGIDKQPSELTAEEIKNAKLVCADKFDKKYADCKLPTLDDVLAVIPKDKSFELEIKHYGDGFADKVEAARIKAGLDYSNILITSFRDDVIRDFKKKYPKYETLFIVWVGKDAKPEPIIERAKNAGASQVAIGGYRNINADFVAKIKAAGLKVGVWQVENLDDLAFAARLGVDRVCSNYASRLRRDFETVKSLDFK